MTAIRTIIADDEAMAREGLRDMLRQEPEFVFLDVQMPGMNGFEALRAVDTETLPVVIFVTVYDRYALRAFDVHAVAHPFERFMISRMSA